MDRKHVHYVILYPIIVMLLGIGGIVKAIHSTSDVSALLAFLSGCVIAYGLGWYAYRIRGV